MLQNPERIKFLLFVTYTSIRSPSTINFIVHLCYNTKCLYFSKSKSFGNSMVPPCRTNLDLLRPDRRIWGSPAHFFSNHPFSGGPPFWHYIQVICLCGYSIINIFKKRKQSLHSSSKCVLIHPQSPFCHIESSKQQYNNFIHAFYRHLQGPPHF